MRKLIDSSFELDLSSFKITETLQTSWFNDHFWTKYTFPFEIDLVRDIDIAFGFISLYNTTPITFFKCKLVKNNTIQDAEFEITEMGEKLSCTLSYGFEQLPSFDKKLSELSLQTFDLPSGVSIYQHANSVISQTWPAVNYNFPAVHTDKYDTSTAFWADFKETINNRQNGVFLENYYNTVDDDSVNYNIMQPLPYWLHVLERGFADAGYGFGGEILQDARLKKALLFGDVEYFENPNQFQFSDDVEIEDCSKLFSRTLNGIDLYFYNYTKLTNISRPGRYIFDGDLYSALGISVINLAIKINGVIVHTATILPYTNNSNATFEFLVTAPNSVVEVLIYNYEHNDYNYLFFDYNIASKYYTDSLGNPEPSVQNKNKIELKKAVPDITFEDFVKVVKNWFNYDIDVIDNVVYMNRIDGNINHKNAIDMQAFEVKTPRRKFKQGSSFLLKFADVDSKVYKYEKVFQDISQVLNSGYKENEKTQTIEINALPLPLLTRNGLNSAFAFEDNNSKVFLVAYDGLTGNRNLALPILDYLLPSVHLAYWKKWFDFRINSVGYFWAFKAFEQSILGLKDKVKIYAFGNTHIVKSVQRTEIAPEVYTVELETESL